MATDAVVLLSGGLDSATVLAMARQSGYACHALSFDYGQRHAVELAAARRVAAAIGAVRHQTVAIDLRRFGGSALTDDIAVPASRAATEMDSGIPVTYVPARNTILLSCALAYAEVIGCRDLFIGVSATDYSGYPDCRPEFIAAFEALANLATRDAVEGGGRYTVHAPLMRLSKAETIAVGVRLGVDYGLTSTCYDPTPNGHPCRHCESCELRARGFAEAGIADPLLARR